MEQKPDHRHVFESKATAHVKNEVMFYERPMLTGLRDSGLLHVRAVPEAGQTYVNETEYSRKGLEFAARVAYACYECIPYKEFNDAFLATPGELAARVMSNASSLLGYRRGRGSRFSDPDNFVQSNIAPKDFLNQFIEKAREDIRMLNTPDKQYNFWRLAGAIAMVSGRPDIVKAIIEQENMGKGDDVKKLSPKDFASVFNFAWEAEKMESHSVGVIRSQAEGNVDLALFNEYSTYFPRTEEVQS